MTAGIRGYLLAVAAAGILVSLAAALLPKGAMHRTGQFVGWIFPTWPRPSPGRG